jgi:hypothetical protein
MMPLTPPPPHAVMMSSKSILAMEVFVDVSRNLRLRALGAGARS